MLSGTIILWGLNFTVTKYVLTHGFKPLAYSPIRYGGAALLFGALTLRREGSLKVGRRSIPLLVAAGAVGILLNQLTYMYAVKLTTATTVALILGITPIFAALVEHAALPRCALRAAHPLRADHGPPGAGRRRDRGRDRAPAPLAPRAAGPGRGARVRSRLRARLARKPPGYRFTIGRILLIYS